MLAANGHHIAQQMVGEFVLISSLVLPEQTSLMISSKLAGQSAA